MVLQIKQKKMTKFKCEILHIEKVTSDVYQLTLEKPEGYSFTSGEAP